MEDKANLLLTHLHSEGGEQGLVMGIANSQYDP